VRLLLHLAPLLIALTCCACPGNNPDPDTPDAGAPAKDAGASDAGDSSLQPDGGVRPARTDFVAPIGTDDTLDLATWNIEHFPKTTGTPELLADLIRSLDLDLVALQEITSEAAFDDVLARLPDHEGILSTHTYPTGDAHKLALITKSSLLTVSEVDLLFTSSPYAFPRPPLRARILVHGAHPFDFTVIVVHLKAGVGDENAARRTEAMIELEALMRHEVDGPGDDDIVLLGDMNEVLSHPNALPVWAPLLDAPERYTVLTRAIAESGGVSFIPAGIMLDHIVVTTSLIDEIDGRAPFITRLHDVIPGYLGTVSDHLPVSISLTLQ
jgi:endonuclease/exonuclease/phosphatase family metal-dependent hydrolase